MIKLPRIKKSTVQHIYKKLTRTPKQKIQAKEKRLKALNKRQAHKTQLISMFGKLRYYLALLFGEWVLWTGRKTHG